MTVLLVMELKIEGHARFHLQKKPDVTVLKLNR